MVEKAEKTKVRKILVTGSGGMLGTALCRELSGDYDVAGIDINRAVLPVRGFVKCDITDRKNTLKSIRREKPGLVIHAAAWTDVDGCEREPDKAHRINTEGTQNVAFAASELNIPLIYISTDFIFDGSKKTPYAEDARSNPLNVYAKSKLEGEKAARGLNKHIILRTSWLFGANGKNFVDTILNKAKKEKELRVVNDQVGSPTYAKDLAEAISKLLRLSPLRETYHVSNKGAVSWFDYAKEIIKIAGIDVPLIPIKSRGVMHYAPTLNRPAKRPAFSVLDNAKFEKATNFTMRSWQEALEEYLSNK